MNQSSTASLMDLPRKQGWQPADVCENLSQDNCLCRRSIRGADVFSTDALTMTANSSAATDQEHERHIKTPHYCPVARKGLRPGLRGSSALAKRYITPMH